MSNSTVAGARVHEEGWHKNKVRPPGRMRLHVGSTKSAVIVGPMLLAALLYPPTAWAVSGGENDTEGAYRSIGYVWGAHTCSGTLICPAFVLTANHCITGATGSDNQTDGRGHTYSVNFKAQIDDTSNPA